MTDDVYLEIESKVIAALRQFVGAPLRLTNTGDDLAPEAYEEMRDALSQCGLDPAVIRLTYEPTTRQLVVDW